MLSPAEAEYEYDPEANRTPSKSPKAPKQILLLPARKPQPTRTLMLVLALILAAWHLYTLNAPGRKGQPLDLDLSAVLP